MPTGLREIESSFKQVQKDYQGYAKRRQVLAIEVAAQENSLKRIKIAICEERQAINTERQLLHQEKEAFEVFRKEVLQDLQTQCEILQVEQEELKLHQHCKGHSNLGSMAQHTCQEVQYQELADTSGFEQQRDFGSEQAQLIADLQQRLNHLATVTASFDDQRETQLQMQQQQLQQDAEAVHAQRQQLSRDRVQLQAERLCLRQKTAPLADVTWTCNQQHHSLADLLATLKQKSSPR